MSTTKTISRNLGGDRLGSGSKNNIDLHAYNRSTHDLSRTWRSSMNVGTLVPFFVELGQNGDSFEMDLDNITRTLPSTGPLYGSYKLQLDVFECPIRLYNGLLHNNMTGIGLNMAQVKFPKIKLESRVKNRRYYNENLNKSQISKSSLINYLGLNGIADADFSNSIEQIMPVRRKFNAIPLLSYWDIYKNYYANKQEEKGAFICANPKTEFNQAENITFINALYKKTYGLEIKQGDNEVPVPLTDEQIFTRIVGEDIYNRYELTNTTHIELENFKEATDLTKLYFVVYNEQNDTYAKLSLSQISYSYEILENGNLFIQLNATYQANYIYAISGVIYEKDEIETNNGLEIETFELSEIDDMRIKILKSTGLNEELLVNDIVDGTLWPKMCEVTDGGYSLFKFGQHGIGLKTYQSDLFNNWLQTEWIDGNNGINKITAIDTSSGSFEIDAFILAKKIYNMLNRVAVSGGSYEDWQEAVYSVKAIRRAETPIYRGGMSAEIMFSEVVSNAATDDDPLGTLAGKGGEHAKKGGKIEISCDEPCIIMGIVSITPRVDYSQGNSWIMTELDNMDDIHKPALDGIGFQDLLQEQMAYWGTVRRTDGTFEKLAAGKVPAWMNYMTAINEAHGEFADEEKYMFMTLNRRYQFYTGNNSATNSFGISDLTTYIDPAKYNYIFADSTLDAQNFWVQIGIRVTARRIMSAKVIPFL